MICIYSIKQAPYIVAQQDSRLQHILDQHKNVIFLSGHTHVCPTIELDETQSNLYINAGSICPTTIKGPQTTLQQGNVILMELSESGISIMIKGIHNDQLLIRRQIPADSK